MAIPDSLMNFFLPNKLMDFYRSLIKEVNLRHPNKSKNKENWNLKILKKTWVLSQSLKYIYKFF